MEAALPKGRRVAADPRALHEHRRGLRFTGGVAMLLGSANASWILDVIAVMQPKALRDPWLRDFQLWELFRRRNRRVVIVCSYDSENVAFRLTLGRIDDPLAYTRLYVTRGVVCLPREHRTVLHL